MKVLVTGAGGVLGQAVVVSLRKEGYDVLPVSGKGDCNLENIDEVLALFENQQPNTVIHLAAAVYGLGGNVRFPADIYRRNIIMNTNVIEACVKFSTGKIIAMGTVAMYSDDAPLPCVETDVMMGEPHSSERFYAFAKRGMLMQLEACKLQYSLHFAMLLSTNLYGPGDRFDERFGHVVPSLISKFVSAEQRHESVEIWGDGSPLRDFLYAEDAAAGIVSTLQHGDGIYNLVSGVSISIRQLVDELKSHFPSVPVRWDASKPLGQLKREYSVKKLKEIGFEPSFDLKEGIARTVDWYRSHLHTARRYDI